jgi:Zn-dependent M32 family carboxypeptidase
MTKIIEDAIDLLESPNLVWSDDFEAIRHHLWAVLKCEQKSLGMYQATEDLCRALLDDFENNLTVS